MERLTAAVAEKLLDLGADLVGIAPVSRFANAPEGHRPTDFMPECKSVISIGLHLFQGMADVWGEHDEPGKTITPYLFYGYGLTNLEAARIASRVARLLEYRGYKTLCFMPTWPTSSYKYFEESLKTNKMWAEFSHRHAAVAAGVASLGWNGLCLTPEFGSMQRFNSILTSAELEPSPLYDGPPLCRPDRCGMKCVRVCPAAALSEDQSRSFEIEGRTTTYSTHDSTRCLYGIHGLIEGSGGRSRVKIPPGPGIAKDYEETIKGQQHEVSKYDLQMRNNCGGIICGNFCGKCLHECPSRKLAEKDLKSWEPSKRHSVLQRSLLG